MSVTQRKFKHITRKQQGGGGGWQVRVRLDDEVHTRFFNDSAYDSVEAALRHALNHRDEIRRSAGRPMQPQIDPGQNYKSVSRIDQDVKGTHGWYVRVGFRGEWRVKFFSDLQYDGREGALAAALEYRDEMEKELGKPRTDRVVPAPKPRNNTGILGVSRVEKPFRDRNGEVQTRAVFEVTWTPEPNVIQRTSVSINKYGEKEALRRALKIRREKEREIYGKVLSQNNAAKQEQPPEEDTSPQSSQDSGEE